MGLGYLEHHNVWLNCKEVLDEVKEEIRSEARALRNNGSVKDVWVTRRALVPVKGWKTLKGRLQEIFQDDNDPLNARRREVADIFYASQTIPFKVQFRDEIALILEGKEPIKKENTSDSEESEDIIDEISDSETYEDIINDSETDGVGN